MVKADFGIIANNTDAVSERYNNQRVRDSSARPDEPVRTGKSFFYRPPQKKIAAPARMKPFGRE